MEIHINKYKMMIANSKRENGEERMITINEETLERTLTF